MSLSVSPGVASPFPSAYESGSSGVSGPDRLLPGLSVRSIADAGWRAFVASQPAATIFHHPAWSGLLAQTYGYRPFALVQLDAAEEICGGLPVLEIRSRLTGHAYVSLPFTDYCPPLARDDNCMSELVPSLVSWQLGRRDVRFDVHAALPPGSRVHPLTVGVRHVLSLEEGEERLARRLKGTPVQRGIQKAIRDGVEIEISRSSESLDPFYRLHWLSRRRQGVPVQPRGFIRRIWTHLVERDLGFVVVASAGGRPVASAVFLSWNGILIYKYGASDPAYWKLRPNNLVMWTAIQWGCQQGYRLFDFGKSELANIGLRNFKSRWGADELPLVYTRIASKPPSTSSWLPMEPLSQLIRVSPPIVCRGLGALLYGHLAALGEVAVGTPDTGSATG